MVAAASGGKRERARLQKRAQRAKAREAARLAVEAMAATREGADERLAPAIRRNPVLRLDGTMLLGSRVTVQNGRATRANPIDNLAKNSPLFGERHKKAADRFQKDWDLVGSGVNASVPDLLSGVGGHGDGTGGHTMILAQVQARERLGGAIDCLGPFVSGVVRVVVHSLPVVNWAQEAKLQPADALTQLSAGLLRLSQYYSPPNPDHSAHHGIRTAYLNSASGAV